MSATNHYLNSNMSSIAQMNWNGLVMKIVRCGKTISIAGRGSIKSAITNGTANLLVSGNYDGFSGSFCTSNGIFGYIAGKTSGIYLTTTSNVGAGAWFIFTGTLINIYDVT